jgi:MATE family multidrug resistance protein
MDQPKPSWIAELRQLLKLFFPIISGQLCQQAIGVTDTVMAGAAGASELSGVALGASFFVPCMLAMTGMSLGIHPTVTRLLGAGRECEIPSRVRQAALVLLGFAFFLIALLLLLRPIYALIPSDPRMLEVARGYLAAVCFALPALAVCSLLRGFCESLSRTLPTLVFGLVCFALNVPLNWIFIYGKFGMPALGGIGCGVATALTLNIAALLFALWIARAKFCARYRFWQKSVSSGLQGCVSYLKLGAPLALSSAIEGAAFALSALIISPFGPEIVAAHSVALNVSGLYFMVPLALAMAATIRSGFFIGACDRAHYLNLLRTAYAVNFALYLLCVASLWCWRFDITALYTSDPKVAATAGLLLAFCCVYMLPDTVQMMSVGILRGFKDSKSIFKGTLIAYWALSMPLGAALALGIFTTPMDACGIWAGFIAGLSAASVYYGLKVKSRTRDFLRECERRDNEPLKNPDGV